MNALEKMIDFCQSNSKSVSLWIDIEPAAQEYATLTAELNHRFVTCTWCGWRLDYEADGVEAAHKAANEHALNCKADPRTAELEAVKRERDELREALKQAADELWGKHYRTAKTEWATDDVAKHYADKLVDNYKTIAKEAGQK